MAIRLGQLNKTAVEPLTASDNSWQDPGMPGNAQASGALWFGHYLLTSDQAFHINVGAAAAPSTSLRIPANTIVEITLQDQDTLHFILATGGTTSSLWITKKSG